MTLQYSTLTTAPGGWGVCFEVSKRTSPKYPPPFVNGFLEVLSSLHNYTTYVRILADSESESDLICMLAAKAASSAPTGTGRLEPDQAILQRMLRANGHASLTAAKLLKL